jgi:hypothetical protein
MLFQEIELRFISFQAVNDISQFLCHFGVDLLGS